MHPARLVPDEELPPTAPVPPPPWPGRTVQLDGTALHVRETPPTRDGLDPALYVHGLGGSATNWTDVAALLAGRVDGRAIDLPGFGRSDPAPRGGYRQAALADRVARWIEHDGRGPVHLLGNSLGGAVALRVAAVRPDLVRTLTLISPAMPVVQARSVHARLLPMMLVPNITELAERRVAAIPPERMARMVVEMCWADPSRVHPERLVEAAREQVRRRGLAWTTDAYVRSLRGLVTSYLAPGERSLWRLARQVAAPTLVVWGRQDRLVDVRLAPRTARAVPDSRLMVLDRVGHVAQMEQPRPVARAVAALLEDAAAAARRQLTAG